MVASYLHAKYLYVEIWYDRRYINSINQSSFYFGPMIGIMDYQAQINRVGIKVALNTLKVISEISFQPITWLEPVNKIKQQLNYNASSLIGTYK